MPTLPGCRSQDLRINIDRDFRRRRVSVGVGWWMVFQTFTDHCLVGEGKQSRRVCQAPGGWLPSAHFTRCQRTTNLLLALNWCIPGKIMLHRDDLSGTVGLKSNAYPSYWVFRLHDQYRSGVALETLRVYPLLCRNVIHDFGCAFPQLLRD